MKIKAVFQDAASAAINQMTMTAKSAARGLAGIFHALSGSLESLGGTAGKVVGAVGGIIQGFAAFGTVGLLIAGVSKAFEWMGEKCNAAKKAASEAAAAIRTALQNDQLERMGKALAAATTEADHASQKFDKLAASYLKVASAATAVAKASADLQISQLAAAKEAAMGNASSKGEAALAGADYDIKIAQQKLASATEAAAAQVEAARQQAEDDAKRLAAANDRVDAAKLAVSTAESELALAEAFAKDDSEKWGAQLKAVQAKREAAIKAVADAETARKLAVDSLAVAEKNLERAEIDQERAITDAKTGVAAAERAKRELELAQAEAARAEQERQQKEALKKQHEELLKTQTEINTDYQSAMGELNAAIQARAAAEQSLARLEAEYEANWARNEMAAAAHNAPAYYSGLNGGKGGSITAAGGEIAKGHAQRVVIAGIEQGSIATVAQLRKAEAEAQRQFDKENRAEAIARARDAETAARLRAKSPKALSDAEKKWLEDYEKIEQAANDKAAKLDTERQKAREAAEAEKKARENLELKLEELTTIRKKLDKLGLK